MTGPQLKRKSDPVSHEPAWRLETTETTVCQWGGNRDQYVLAFERAIRAMLRGAPADELDDVVSTEVLRVAEGYEHYSVKFPDPVHLAYVRGEERRALWDWRRGQAVQRGAGARFGREVISLSKTYLPPKVKVQCQMTGDIVNDWDRRKPNQVDHRAGEEGVAKGPSVEAQALDPMIRQQLLATLTAGLSDTDRYIFEEVVGRGRKQAQVAAEVGLTRETVNRRLNEALRKMRELAASELVAGELAASEEPSSRRSSQPRLAAPV